MTKLDKINDLKRQYQEAIKEAEKEMREEFKAAYKYIKDNGYERDEYGDSYSKLINDGYRITICPPVFDPYSNQCKNYYYVGVTAADDEGNIYYENMGKIKSFDFFIKTIENQIKEYQEKWQLCKYTFTFTSNCHTDEEFIEALQAHIKDCCYFDKFKFKKEKIKG